MSDALPPPHVTFGIDPGSARCGICALSGREVIGVATIAVDRSNLGPATAAILSAIDVASPARIAIEWSARPYAPAGATPQAIAAMAAARETMAVLIDRVEQGCEARGIPVTRMPAATWRSRIGAAGRRREGDERSGDERVRDGLRGAHGPWR